jgi:hypothetical protein
LNRVRRAWAIHPRSMRESGLFALLLGLVLISSLSGPIGWLTGSRPATQALAGRECQPPPSEDGDPLEDPDPLDVEGPEGVEAKLVPRAEVRLLRSNSRRASEFPRTRANAPTAVRPRTARAWIRAALPASGRALRHWLRSQTC